MSVKNERIDGYNIAKPLVLVYHRGDYVLLPNVDAKYGPYTSREEALRIIDSGLRAVGLTIGIINSQEKIIDEYWFQGGILDEHLVIKTKNGDSKKFETFVIDFEDFKTKLIKAVEDIKDIDDKVKRIIIDSTPEILEREREAIIEAVMQVINTSDRNNAELLIDNLSMHIRQTVLNMVNNNEVGGPRSDYGLIDDQILNVVRNNIHTLFTPTEFTSEQFSTILETISNRNVTDAERKKVSKNIATLFRDYISSSNVEDSELIKSIFDKIIEKVNGKIDPKPNTDDQSGSTSGNTLSEISGEAFLNAFKSQDFNSVIDYLSTLILVDGYNPKQETATKFYNLFRDILISGGLTKENSFITGIISKLESSVSDEDKTIFNAFKNVISNFIENNNSDINFIFIDSSINVVPDKTLASQAEKFRTSYIKECKTNTSIKGALGYTFDPNNSAYIHIALGDNIITFGVNKTDGFVVMKKHKQNASESLYKNVPFSSIFTIQNDNSEKRYYKHKIISDSLSTSFSLQDAFGVRGLNSTKSYVFSAFVKFTDGDLSTVVPICLELVNSSSNEVIFSIIEWEPQSGLEDGDSYTVRNKFNYSLTISFNHNDNTISLIVHKENETSAITTGMEVLKAELIESNKL